MLQADTRDAAAIATAAAFIHVTLNAENEMWQVIKPNCKKKTTAKLKKAISRRRKIIVFYSMLWPMDDLISNNYLWQAFTKSFAIKLFCFALIKLNCF